MYLVDTNIVSELLRPRPNPGVISWIATQRTVAYAAVSVEEAIFGLSRKDNLRLLQGFERFLAERCTVYPVTEDIARRAGTMRGEFSKRGIVRSQPDMLIAATAQVHALTLVTRNVRDFKDCGIGLLNPFTADFT
ncbi:MAG: type II toxin-antitoxin system VapC family toxin [Candidatus Methylumidiphilus sp.]